MKKLAIFFVFLFSLFLLSRPAVAVESTCVVFFTGIGCPHCAKVDPVLHEELPEKYPDLVIIEYEIYQERGNASLIYEYDDVYSSGLGIPLIIFGKDDFLIGD